MQKRDQQMSRLYIIVPEDLPPGLAAAQVAHVAFQYATRHPEITLEWLRDSQYLIVLTVPDEESLVLLATRALEAGLVIESWHEPDFNDQFTALALQPGEVARRLTSNLPLLGRLVPTTSSG